MPFFKLATEATALPELSEAVPPIFYEFYKQGAEGPILLLIHGAGNNYLSWPPQLRRLAGARVYALDLPGHGQSAPLRSKEGSDVTVATYAAVINGMIHQLALAPVVLVGHSMGAAIALRCALQWQNDRRLAPMALVLVGAGATLPVNQRIFEGLQQDFAGITAKLVAWMYGPTISEKHQLRAVEELRKNSAQQLIADFQACNRYDVRDQLPQLTLPTLIICGEYDKMTPVAASQLLAQRITKSELHIVPDSGHMVMLERPEAVTELIQTFVNTHNLDPRT